MEQPLEGPSHGLEGLHHAAAAPLRHRARDRQGLVADVGAAHYHVPRLGAQGHEQPRGLRLPYVVRMRARAQQQRLFDAAVQTDVKHQAVLQHDAVRPGLAQKRPYHWQAHLATESRRVIRAGLGPAQRPQDILAQPLLPPAAAQNFSQLLIFRFGPFLRRSRRGSLTLALRKVRVSRILLRNSADGKGPPDPEERVVPAQPAGAVRIEKFRYHVEDLGFVDQSLKAVRESLGDIQYAAVLLAQLHGCPTLKGRRDRTQVYDHVVNGSFPAGYQLGLCMGGQLIVHSPHRPLRLVEGDIALGHLKIDAVGLKLLLAKRPGKKAAAVLEPLRLDDQRAAQFGLNEDHRARTPIRTSYDPDLRNRQDEFSPAPAVLRLLL